MTLHNLLQTTSSWQTSHAISSLIKSNLHYTCGNTSKRVTSGGIHLRGLAQFDLLGNRTTELPHRCLNLISSQVLIIHSFRKRQQRPDESITAPDPARRSNYLVGHALGLAGLETALGFCSGRCLMGKFLFFLKLIY